jgi:hypothetical protein
MCIIATAKAVWAETGSSPFFLRRAISRRLDATRMALTYAQTLKQMITVKLFTVAGYLFAMYFLNFGFKYAFYI